MSHTKTLCEGPFVRLLIELSLGLIYCDDLNKAKSLTLYRLYLASENLNDVFSQSLTVARQPSLLNVNCVIRNLKYEGQTEMILVHFISSQGFKNEELKYPVYGRQLLLHFSDADNLNTEIKANLPLYPSYSMTFKKKVTNTMMTRTLF
jgi:hypothetical protein